MIDIFADEVAYMDICIRYPMIEEAEKDMRGKGHIWLIPVKQSEYSIEYSGRNYRLVRWERLWFEKHSRVSIAVGDYIQMLSQPCIVWSYLDNFDISTMSVDKFYDFVSTVNAGVISTVCREVKVKK